MLVLGVIKTSPRRSSGRTSNARATRTSLAGIVAAREAPAAAARVVELFTSRSETFVRRTGGWREGSTRLA